METSKEMILNLISQVTLGSTVLEPSAGIGKIVAALLHKRCKVHACELNASNVEVLKNYPINYLWHGDFLKVTPYEIYDFVVAVPPYKDNIDCQHIMKMYDCVKKGGKVISYTLPTWITGMYSNQIAFRKWLSDKNFTIKFHEDKSYVACPKMIITITK